MLQDGTLAAWQLEPGAGDTDIPPDRIEEDVSCLESDAQRPSRTPQQRLRACDKFRHGERLYEVIVCAGVEAANSIFDGIPRRKNQNRQRVAGSPQLRQQIQSVTIGKAQIKD